jgi:hypothetical protein
MKGLKNEYHNQSICRGYFPDRNVVLGDVFNAYAGQLSIVDRFCVILSCIHLGGGSIVWGQR